MNNLACVSLGGARPVGVWKGAVICKAGEDLLCEGLSGVALALYGSRGSA